jgi:KamA family protein
MTETTRFKAINAGNIDRLPQWQALDPLLQRAVRVVATVLPFRTNHYVVDQLIDWGNLPADPIFQLTFPQRGMLSDADFETMAALVDSGADRTVIEEAANRIRSTLNPHPAGQMTHNVPEFECGPVDGIQHKYRETVLFFPNRGQTCHAYCTFCFRWAQFVGPKELRFGTDDTELVGSYLAAHPEVTDVLITGGDPLIMKTRVLRRYIEPLLKIDHLTSIRIGSKAVAYWPQRFVTDDDADDLLGLFEEIVAAGKHVALMGHYTHPVELSTDIAQDAARRVVSTGANIRMQSPVLRHINAAPETWAALWRQGIQLGLVPYYMFVVRDTGARAYFEVPLAEAQTIFRRAYRQVSGLARTVRGPSMSATPGKIRVAGTAEVSGKRVFVLEYLQARAPERVAVPFFAEFDEHATWFDQLRPIREADHWLFEDSVTRHHEKDEVPTPVQIIRRPGPVDSRPDRPKRSSSPVRTEK